MIKKATAYEWNQLAQTPGTLLKHRRRGHTYSFTVIDAQTGEVVGLAVCDQKSGKEDFLLEMHYSSRFDTNGLLERGMEMYG